MPQEINREILPQALEYIENFWKESTRHNPHDRGDLLALPHPYLVPNPGFFETMFYWDSYFCIKSITDIHRVQLRSRLHSN